MDTLLHTLLQHMMSQTYDHMTQNYSERTLGIISRFDAMVVESMQQQSFERKKKGKEDWKEAEID